MSNISDFRGKVSLCSCTNYDPKKPMGCNRCYSRGYLAECLGCLGSGQKEEPVAGGNGMMRSTCPVCGGSGSMGVNKPADWDVLHPVAEEVAPTAEPELAAV